MTRLDPFSPSFSLPLFNSDSHKRQILFLRYTSAIHINLTFFPCVCISSHPSLNRHLRKMDISLPFFSHFSLTLYKAIFLYFLSLYILQLTNTVMKINAGPHTKTDNLPIMPHVGHQKSSCIILVVFQGQFNG